MRGNPKHTGRTSSVPGGLAAGAMVSTILTALITAVLAVLLDKEIIRWENVGYGVLAMVMLSAFCGAVTANAKIRRQRFLVSLMSGLVYFGILLSITALFFGGQFEAVGVTGLLVAGGCACAALPSGGQGRRGYSRIRRA